MVDGAAFLTAQMDKTQAAGIFRAAVVSMAAMVASNGGALNKVRGVRDLASKRVFKKDNSAAATADTSVHGIVYTLCHWIESTRPNLSGLKGEEKATAVLAYAYGASLVFDAVVSAAADNVKAKKAEKDAKKDADSADSA
ncbi:MAG: hypothetical protein RL375_3185, partial [Pseudomonadota bacterium]